MKHIQWIILLMLACVSCSGTSRKQAADTAASTTFSNKADVSADSLYRFVEEQVALGPRTPGSDAHSACGNLIVSRLNAFGIDSIAEQRVPVTTFNGKRFTARNIFASINPSATNRVLLLAHYDTRPWADNEPDPSLHSTPVLGANDGASGVAVLLEAARLLGSNPPDSIGVDLLFVDMEDSGEDGGPEETWCLGTQQWVTQMPYTSANRPRYAILLDMVGGIDAKFYREYFSEQGAPQYVDRIWAVARESGFANRFVNRRGGGVVDDHIFITRAGIPCVDIIECVNDHTGSFNPTWHTTSDNLSAIDRNTLHAVAQTVMNTIL